MKRIFIVALAAICMGVLPAKAAFPNYNFGGAVFNQDLMMPGDFAALSGVQNFGTARAMGMGGAFVSLGADMTSLSLNPAGLGMYRHNEFSLTPVVTISKASTPGALSSVLAGSSNSKNRFAMANLGVALNVFESTRGALTSLTLGFGMNRIADFNTSFSFGAEDIYNEANGPVFSIADAYVAQLQKGCGANGWNPILPENNKDNPSNPNGMLYPDDYDAYFWPAVLGYKGEMIQVNNSNNGKYWSRGDIGDNASILRSLNQTNTGSINEFDIATGMNFNNIIYVGATIGIQSVYKRTETTYREDYGYFNGTDGYATDDAGNVLDKQLTYSDLWQRVKLNGSGVNFKIGVIARPIPALRLGVAFHTPTYYSLERRYDTDMYTQIEFNKRVEGEDKYVTTYNRPDRGMLDAGGDSWEFVSPSRLMFGASYTFGNFAILSADYERDWYNGIRVKNVPYEAAYPNAFYKDEFKHNFVATNAVRVGLEVKPIPVLALRVGGGYTTSMLKDKSLAYDMPLNTESHYFSGGLGFAFSPKFSLDVAYQYQADSQNRYFMFYSVDADSGQFVNSTNLFKNKYTRHFVSMTLAFRF